jgi:hypothetical protein
MSLLVGEVDAAAAAVGADVEVAAAGVPAAGILTPHDHHLSLRLGSRAEAKRLRDLLRVDLRRSPGRAQPCSLAPVQRHNLAPGRQVELRVQAPLQDSVQLRVLAPRIALLELVQRPGN